MERALLGSLDSAHGQRLPVAQRLSFLNSCFCQDLTYLRFGESADSYSIWQKLHKRTNLCRSCWLATFHPSWSLHLDIGYSNHCTAYIVLYCYTSASSSWRDRKCVGQSLRFDHPLHRGTSPSRLSICWLGALRALLSCAGYESELVCPKAHGDHSFWFGVMDRLRAGLRCPILCCALKKTYSTWSEYTSNILSCLDISTRVVAVQTCLVESTFVCCRPLGRLV